MPDPRDPRRVAAELALRVALERAAREALAAQSQLQDMTAGINAVGERVIAVVGGSAQGVDKELVQSLREVAHHTNTAVSALGAAASSSRTAI